MSYEKGKLAFFDGTKSEFKKPRKQGEKIAGYEVREINASGVKIAGDSKEFEMKVGQQLRREEEGEWQLASGSEVRTTPAGGGSSAPTGGAADSEEEAVKRLMEKRAKELKE